MILFELRCGKDHRFEAWFKDGAAYEEQAAAAVICCPHCGDTDVSKAPMAPKLIGKRGKDVDVFDAAAEMRRLLGRLRETIEDQCEDVGERFPDEARAIHYGDAEPRGIYGSADEAEAKALEDEGIPVSRVPWVRKDN